MNDLIKEITPSELQQISTRITDSRDMSRQLTWSHFIELAEVSEPTKPEDEQEKVLTIAIAEKAKSVAMDAMDKALNG
jgi:hypothetical protein